MKKKCVGCGKQIPSVALDCVFCSTKQPLEGEVVVHDRAAPSATDPTQLVRTGDGEESAPKQPLLGMPTGEIHAVVAGFNEHANGESAATGNGVHDSDSPASGNGQPGIPSQARLTAAMSAIVLPPETEEVAAASTAHSTHSEQAAQGHRGSESADSTPYADPREGIARGALPEDQPFLGLQRTVMGVGGVVLIALFFLPWHGVSSWQLLETLGGPEFVRQLFYLTGGIVLLTSAVLPLPFAFRALIGAAVAATPVLLGAGGMLEGWRGVVAALAVLGLPATHLLHSRAKSSTAARGLVMVAVAAVVVLYLVPISSVVPIVGVIKMIFSGEIGPAVMGIFILIPLIFAGLSLLGLMGRDLTDVGVLLSVLSLLWAPTVIALRGLLIDDGTQLYVATALLWASATAALSMAQLLSLAARDARFAA